MTYSTFSALPFAPLSMTLALATSLHASPESAGRHAAHRIDARPPADAGCETSWLANPGGVPGLNGRVNALLNFDDGAGSALYAGGLFTTASGVTLNYVGKWDGATWSPLGSGVNNEVQVLADFDDGDGPALYAGGVFSMAGGEVVNRIAKWDGENWSALDAGLNNRPFALAVYDDGTGPALYVGGEFTTASGVTVNRIAKWDGVAWSALDTGVNSAVLTLAVHDDGGGSRLFVGGGFTVAGGASGTSRIATWNGAAWAPLADGLGGAGPAAVNAMTVYDDGCGPRLYVGGGFTTDGVTTLNRVARWDGVRWSALGSGADGNVYELSVFDDGLGAGPTLYAGGAFTTAGGVSANRIATWNGRIWSALGQGWSQAVFALADYDDGRGDGAQLFAGGWFSSWPEGNGYFARLQPCPPVPPLPGDLDGNGSIDVLDLLILLGQWGECPEDPCGPAGPCIADINADGVVDVSDLLTLLGSWG